MTPTATQDWLIESLHSSECPACGSRKRPRTSICFRCWRSLASHLRQPLYKLVGSGYEQAHAAAMHDLGVPYPPEALGFSSGAAPAADETMSPKNVRGRALIPPDPAPSETG